MQSRMTYVCPTDRTPLTQASPRELVCASGHAYPVDEYSGIPTLFDRDYGDPFHADSQDPFGQNPDEYPDLELGEIDAFVQDQIRATGGNLYSGATLRTYPSPRFPLVAPFAGAVVIDVGSGWGRWSLAATRRDWHAVGVDPWIDNCRAFQRVARQLDVLAGVEIVNGDGRRLPFPDNSAQAAFSYSVLQHLPKSEALDAFNEMVRVVEPGGRVLVQMPNVAGLRQRQLLRRGVVVDREFAVRPWSYNELVDLARNLSSRSAVTVDGFLSLNAQWSERAAMPLRSRAIVAISEFARLASHVVRPLSRVADSLWIAVTVEG
jgi:SAM-dependent methyltransferase